MITKPTKLILFASFAIILCLACKPAKEEAETEEEAPQEINISYPAYGNEYISKLYAETDKVDIIFYDLPISVNQDDAGSAKNTVLYISPTNPKVTVDCKPIARLSWIGDGRIIKEADVYVDTGCEYLLFMEDNAPVAANAMAQSGVAFFRNIISQVQQNTN